jgi:hypothetical protein
MRYEIYLLLVGGAIGIISSVLTTLLFRWSDYSGKLEIYTKIVYSKATSHETWGCFSRNGGMSFQVPLWVEICNTSNITKCIRNFNIVLYNSDTKIGKMTQINQIGNDIIANEGNYSFVIEPRSVKKFDAYFIIKKMELNENPNFDELKISFLDLKGKLKVYHFKNVDNPWGEVERAPDKEWYLLN